MSGNTAPADQHPSHGPPDNTSSTSTQATDKPSTGSHPSDLKPDSTVGVGNGSQGRLTASDASPAAKLSGLKMKLKGALRQYPDFPSKGVLFEDILPIFANPSLHEELLEALEMQITTAYGHSQKPDVIVGLDARGFLFGPSLALRVNAGFVPVRKRGKLPGKTETAQFQKEYGEDFFQLQTDSIKPGQKVIVCDDIIATGGSAAAAGQLVRKAGGVLIGYLFMLELDFLHGRDKLDAPVTTLLSSQETS